MIELKNKYIIGTHVMFYEIDIINEHVQSINNALETVSNKQNVTVDLFFNNLRLCHPSLVRNKGH